MAKPIFKTDANKIRSISNGLRMHQKPNGTQVILSKTNAERVEKVAALLSEAANILELVQ